MTTDATKTSPADRFYVAPTVTPMQPAISAVYAVDLKPLISWWQQEQQRQRDQLLVEQSAARSAREALVACEARLKAVTEERDSAVKVGGLIADELRDKLDHAKCDAAEAQQMLAKERASHAGLVDEYNRRTLERDHAVADLERCKALLSNAEHVKEQAVEECRQVGIRSQMLTGTVPAVIEAYRLLCGHEPHLHKCGEWFDRADGARSSGDGHIDEAKCFLLYWLDEHAPGGRP